MTHYERWAWISIFKNGAIKQVIYLAIFVIIIIGLYIRFEGFLTGKFASIGKVEAIEKTVTKLEINIEKRFDKFETKLDSIQKSIWRLYK